MLLSGFSNSNEKTSYVNPGGEGRGDKRNGKGRRENGNADELREVRSWGRGGSMQVAEAGVQATWGKHKDAEAFPKPFLHYFLLGLPKIKAYPSPCLPPLPSPREWPFSSHIPDSSAWVLGWTWIGCLPSIHLLGSQG